MPTLDPQAIVREHWRDRDQTGRRVCAACRQPWHGDWPTGGCEARLLALKAIALEEFIVRLLASHLYMETLVCHEFGGDTTDSDALGAEWSALRAARAGEGGGG